MTTDTTYQYTRITEVKDALDTWAGPTYTMAAGTLYVHHQAGGFVVLAQGHPHDASLALRFFATLAPDGTMMLGDMHTDLRLVEHRPGALTPTAVAAWLVGGGPLVMLDCQLSPTTYRPQMQEVTVDEDGLLILHRDAGDSNARRQFGDMLDTTDTRIAAKALAACGMEFTADVGVFPCLNPECTDMEEVWSINAYLPPDGSRQAVGLNCEIAVTTSLLSEVAELAGLEQGGTHDTCDIVTWVSCVLNYGGHDIFTLRQGETVPRTTLTAPPLRTFTELGYHPAGELTLEEAQQLAGTLTWQVMAAVAGDAVPLVPARRDVTSAFEVTDVGSFFRYTGQVIDGQGHATLEDVLDPVDIDEDDDMCDGWCSESQCFLFEEDDDD